LLFNFAETAPETWGETAIKAANYTEKADIFSYAIILWRLFGNLESEEVYEDPYHHLQSPGKMMADWKLRGLILSVCSHPPPYIALSLTFFFFCVCLGHKAFVVRKMSRDTQSIDYRLLGPSALLSTFIYRVHAEVD
jgi:hypothetical protein